MRRLALGLLARTEAGRRPIRLLGVSLHNLGSDATADGVPERMPRLPFPEPEGAVPPGASLPG